MKSNPLPNGDTEHVYEKVKTSFKGKDGNEIPNYPTEEGDQPKKDIPGYRFVETKKLPNGDVEHVYEKVKTSFKDKEGNEIPNYPTEEGDQPKKDIPGYRFVETKKLPNGDIEHVYEKVTTPTTNVITSWVDEDGNEIRTPEKGEQAPGEVSGYEFVRTITDENGNVKHVFKPVSRIPEASRTTIWTDENGNPIRPSEEGTRNHGEVPGYEFIKTIVDKDGNVRHIFRKVETVTPKTEVKRLANTGSETSNSAAAGFGALIAGIALAVRRRQKKDN